MSTLEAASIVAAVLLVGVPSTFLLIRRAQRAESERDRIVRNAHERARQAAHQDGHTLAEAARADRLPPEVEDHLIHFILDHPDVADGFARLARAIRDEQNQNGDQA